MIAILIAVAAARLPLCPMGTPPIQRAGNTRVCWDGTNLWSPDGQPHEFDHHGFLVASPAAKRKVARECPNANPLYVEAYGKCPVRR